MALSRPTIQEIIDRIAADIVAKITGATTLALRSVLLILGRAYAGAVHLIYGYIDNQSKELFVSTATADADGGKLDTAGSEYGILRKAATPTVGAVLCTGTAGSVIPAGSGMTSSTGSRYTTNAIATISSLGSISVNITCDTGGVAGNNIAGVTLTLESSLVGVNSSATVDSNGLINGTDEETDDEYRQRILTRKRLAPHGGSDYDLETWALEVPGVTRAWAIPLVNGPGTVALYFICDNQSPITPSDSQIANVISYLISHVDSNGQTVGIPTTMQSGLFVSGPKLVPINLTLKIFPNTDEVKTQVETQLDTFYLDNGVPGETLYLSNIGESISVAAGEEHSAIVSPTQDISLAYNELPIPGVITWMDY
jgi:uncharacterized phage protein gp47/JayE